MKRNGCEHSDLTKISLREGRQAAQAFHPAHELPHNNNQADNGMIEQKFEPSGRSPWGRGLF